MQAAGKRVCNRMRVAEKRRLQKDASCREIWFTVGYRLQGKRVYSRIQNAGEKSLQQVTVKVDGKGEDASRIVQVVGKKRV